MTRTTRGQHKDTKRWRLQLAVQLVVGFVLAVFTYELVRGLNGSGSREVFGWLTLTGVGVGLTWGVMIVLTIVLCADAMWLLTFILWLIRKKFHIKAKDNTLYLP